MNPNFAVLLKETQDLLKEETPPEKHDDIHSKVLGMYMYIEEDPVKDASLIQEYNKVVAACKELGIRKVKRYKVKDTVHEHSETKKREATHDAKESEKLALSILEHSKTLKKKTEAFGSMLDVSKTLLDTVTSGVRKNVHHVEKSVDTLEKKEWYTMGTRQMITVFFLVLLLFCGMYFFIRVF